MSSSSFHFEPPYASVPPHSLTLGYAAVVQDASSLVNTRLSCFVGISLEECF